jgi:hypothetical protein
LAANVIDLVTKNVLTQADQEMQCMLLHLGWYLAMIEAFLVLTQMGDAEAQASSDEGHANFQSLQANIDHVEKRPYCIKVDEETGDLALPTIGALDEEFSAHKVAATDALKAFGQAECEEKKRGNSKVATTS